MIGRGIGAYTCWMAIEQEREHSGKIKALFASIAGRYDLLNRLQSLGQDQLWRKRTAHEAASRPLPGGPSPRYLDLATGSGDLAIALALTSPEAHVTGLDLVPELLAQARIKAEARGLGRRTEFVEGNALALPFPEMSFNAVTMAFGIRNIKDRGHALKEMARVTAPGGRVAILELCYHQRPPLVWLYKLYLKAVIPCMAYVFSENPSAYIYLGRSIMDFPSPEGFSAMMAEAGLSDVRDIPLTFGVAHLFVGIRK